MAMKRCPICGEKYSDTYRDCPFCEEEEAWRDGEEIRRKPRSGRRTAHGRQYSLLTPTLVVLILIMAGLLVYLLYGDKLMGKDRDEEAAKLPVEEVTQNPGTEDDPTVGGETDPGTQGGVMPEDPGTTDDPGATTEDPEPLSDYETASKLPAGLNISTEDFTLNALGKTHTIRVSGGSGSYQWISQDDGIASVDQTGKVTAVSGGTTNVLVTDGSKKAVCIVRVRVTETGTQEPADTGSALKAGAGKVVNGGNGVRVRSGPSTDHQILATIPNGSSIQILESAGNGWYKITFSGVGGATTTGYMKGDYLANQ